MILEPGKKLDRFVIKRKLGEGGMGEVYLAEDTKLGRDVALKLLRSEFFDNKERLDRFRREAQTSAKINHSNVMSIFDLGSIREADTDREIFYIVMEYVTGTDLSDYLRTHSLDMAGKLRIAEKIAAGLAAAHRLNIVHRDIKTDNIRIDDDGEPKILDFGLAKPITSALSGGEKDDATHTMSSDLTQEGKILGTISYMSPEQARGEQVDSRSDIFSFGILTYRIFSGEFPFEAGDRVSTLARILEGKHKPIRQVDGSLPYDLERIIDKCLQKDPNERYQDTRDLVVDIRAIRKQFESGISDTSSMIADAGIGSRKKKRSFKLMWPIAVAALLVVIIGGYFIFRGPEQSEAEQEPRSMFADLESLPGRVNEALRKSGIDPDRVNLSGLQQLTQKKDALAILGFENKTGDAELDWLQAGLPEILLTDLSQLGSISLVSRNRVLDCLTPEEKGVVDGPSHEACVHAARSLGASKVLSGSFFKLGDKIRIDARLEDVETGEILFGEKVVGTDPFVLVDSLTHKIAESLNMAVAGTGKVDVTQITSSNPEAYRQYILGMEQFFINQDEATEHLKRAIELDSIFALAHLRVGMSYAFQSKMQFAAQYFRDAERYSKRLPAREKSLVEIYSDIWLRANFDDAMIKTRTYLSNYPEDKEVRGFYALMLSQIQGDFQSALAQLDTVMMIDPDFYLTYLWYADTYRRAGQNEEAIKYAKAAKEMHPTSSKPYENLISFYINASMYDKAEEESRSLLELHPDNRTALYTLSIVMLIKRDFDEARRYLDVIEASHGDDPFVMIGYYSRLANLRAWEGKFNSTLDYLRRSLDTALSTGDSGRVTSASSTLGTYYMFLDFPDSALKYTKMTFDWSTRFEGLDYPRKLAMLKPEREEEARVLLDKALRNLKSRVPPETWHIADNLEKEFEGIVDADTSRLIEAYEGFIESQQDQRSSIYYSLGKTLVRFGEYQKGKDVLSNVVSGDTESTTSFLYLSAVFHIGIAEEELGNTQEAIRRYQEVLKYWGDPEIEIDEIRECRKRLDSLLS